MFKKNSQKVGKEKETTKIKEAKVFFLLFVVLWEKLFFFLLTKKLDLLLSWN